MANRLPSHIREIVASLRNTGLDPEIEHSGHGRIKVRWGASNGVRFLLVLGGRVSHDWRAQANARSTLRKLIKQSLFWDTRAHRVNIARRLDRRNERRKERDRVRDRILGLMRDQGVTLHHLQRPNARFWSLSSGELVSFQTVTDLLNSNQVVGVGDTLFPGDQTLSQTFRYIET
jgi:hypothetical protein